MDVGGVCVERVREFGQVYLALALWRTLEMWMQGKGLGGCARQLVGEVATIKSMDMILPVHQPEQQTELQLCVFAKPDRMVGELLQRLGLQLPVQNRKIAEIVVQKNALS